MTRRPRVPKPGDQLALPVPPPSARSGRGGRRRGAGRKPKNPNGRAGVSHRTRPAHDGRHPVHVTFRAARSLPSLRSERLRELLKRALRLQVKRDYGPFFQVVHFSIQRDHLHLIVEAAPVTSVALAEHPRLLSARARQGRETRARDMLRRGIAGLAVSLARRLNRLLGRRGTVWSDRHHRHELTSPTEVRRALLYVLQNYRRHGVRTYGIGLTDRFSTAPSFGGWAEPHVEARTWLETEPWVRRPRTWLLARGWLRAGGELSTEVAPPLSPAVRFSREALAYRPERRG